MWNSPSVTQDSKIAFQNLKEEEKDWSVAMRKSYHTALSVAVTPDTVWGSTIERDIATRLNRDSTHITRSAVATIPETQHAYRSTF